MTISPPAASTAAPIASGRIPRTATTLTTFTAPPLCKPLTVYCGWIINNAHPLSIAPRDTPDIAPISAETATRQGLSR
jgi:hypothetical protein